MPGFCASTALAFILGVKLFDYVVDEGYSSKAWDGGRQMGAVDVYGFKNYALYLILTI